ncbi:MAG: NrfD/PsrC family molybdoenzyme membrane anchor subunit [Lautropia sp.]
MAAHAVRPAPAERDAPMFYGLVALAGACVVAGLAAAHRIETAGHVVTGMNNAIVWGLPHVFAIFLIVAASGVLNVASIGSVFGQSIYKARARLSALLCVAMLAGGLAVLMLDLGRPERFVVAATRYNFRSVFAWNVFLYSGMFAMAALYLWTLFDRRMARHATPVGIAAMIWRLVLTTGTGSIFAFLVARQAYASALLAPLFVLMSFSWGMAVFLLVQHRVYRWEDNALPEEVHRRMKNLLGVFVAAALYMVAAYHLVNLYFARQHAFEAFILWHGAPYAAVFWIGYVLLGSVLPLALLYSRRFTGPRASQWAAALVVAGAFCFLYVFIVGGQAFPLELFPGAAVSSRFGDGEIAAYSPSVLEAVLGMGGLGIAALMVLVGLRVFDFRPVDAPSPAPGDARAGSPAAAVASDVGRAPR